MLSLERMRAVHRRYIEKRLSIEQIAREIGVPWSTLHRWFVKLRMPRHPSGAVRGRPSPRRGKRYPRKPITSVTKVA